MSCNNCYKVEHPYRERLHPKDVVVFHICRIRNRPNSGHGFKKQNGIIENT